MFVYSIPLSLVYFVSLALFPLPNVIDASIISPLGNFQFNIVHTLLYIYMQLDRREDILQIVNRHLPGQPGKKLCVYYRGRYSSRSRSSDPVAEQLNSQLAKQSNILVTKRSTSRQTVKQSCSIQLARFPIFKSANSSGQPKIVK